MTILSEDSSRGNIDRGHAISFSRNCATRVLLCGHAELKGVAEWLVDLLRCEMASVAPLRLNGAAPTCSRHKQRPCETWSAIRF